MIAEKELFFVIPTYRLRDVSETVQQYDEHFWRNGHAVGIDADVWLSPKLVCLLASRRLRTNHRSAEGFTDVPHAARIGQPMPTHKT
jgi:hypothetical protein